MLVRKRRLLIKAMHTQLWAITFFTLSLNPWHWGIEHLLCIIFDFPWTLFHFNFLWNVPMAPTSLEHFGVGQQASVIRGHRVDVPLDITEFPLKWARGWVLDGQLDRVTVLQPNFIVLPVIILNKVLVSLLAMIVLRLAALAELVLNFTSLRWFLWLFYFPEVLTAAWLGATAIIIDIITLWLFLIRNVLHIFKL